MILKRAKCPKPRSLPIPFMVATGRIQVLVLPIIRDIEVVRVP